MFWIDLFAWIIWILSDISSLEVMLILFIMVIIEVSLILPLSIGGGTLALSLPYPCLISPRDFWNLHQKEVMASVKHEFRSSSHIYCHFVPIAVSWRQGGLGLWEGTALYGANTEICISCSSVLVAKMGSTFEWNSLISKVFCWFRTVCPSSAVS